MRVEAQDLAEALIAALSGAVALERLEPRDDVAPGGLLQLEHEHPTGSSCPERAHLPRALIPRAIAGESPGGQEQSAAPTASSRSRSPSSSGSGEPRSRPDGHSGDSRVTGTSRPIRSEVNPAPWRRERSARSKSA